MRLNFKPETLQAAVQPVLEGWFDTNLGIDMSSAEFDVLAVQLAEAINQLPLQVGSEQAHVICMCPDCVKSQPADADKRWAAWVATMVGGYLKLPLDDPKIGAIATVISTRLWALPRLATEVYEVRVKDRKGEWSPWVLLGGGLHHTEVEVRKQPQGENHGR